MKGINKFTLFLLFIILSVSGYSSSLNANEETRAIVDPEFELIGQYEFNYLSGYNNSFMNDQNIENKNANDHIKIGDINGLAIHNNSSAKVLKFKYDDSQIHSASLNVWFNDFSGKNSTLEEPILLALKKDPNSSTDSFDIIGEKILSFDTDQNGGFSDYEKRDCGVNNRDYRRFSKTYDVKDFVSTHSDKSTNGNIDIIYAVVNIPKTLSKGVTCTTADTNWDMTVVAESPSAPFSYSILVKNPLRFSQRVNEPAILSDSYTFESELFRTPMKAEGEEIKASLLFMGSNRVYGVPAKQEISESLTINQYKNGDSLSSKKYFTSLNPENNIINGRLNSSINGENFDGLTYPKPSSLNYNINGGVTEIIDTNFGRFLEQGVDKLVFSVESESVRDRVGSVSMIGLTIEIDPPTYDLEISNKIINVGEKYEKNYYYKDQEVEHTFKVVNTSLDDLGMTDTYLDINLDSKLDFMLASAEVYNQDGKGVRFIYELENNVLRVYFGETKDDGSEDENYKYKTSKGSEYYIKIKTKVNENVSAEDLQIEGRVSGFMLPYSGGKSNYLLKDVAFDNNTTNTVEYPTLKAGDMAFWQYENIDEVLKALKNNPDLDIKDKVFPGADDVKLVDHNININKDGIYSATYTYTNKDSKEARETISVIVYPRYYLSFESGDLAYDNDNKQGPLKTDLGHEGPEKTKRPDTDPKKLGHVFVGWYEDEDFSKEYDFFEVLTADKTVYAKLVKGELKSKKMVFDSNDNKIAEAQEELTYQIITENTGTVKVSEINVKDTLEYILPYIEDISEVRLIIDNKETSYLLNDLVSSGITFDLDIGEKKVIEFTIKLKSDITENIELKNIAFVSGKEFEVLEDDLLSTIKTGKVKLEAFKNVIDENGNGVAEVNEYLDYTITLKNNGDVDAKNLTLKDDLQFMKHLVEYENIKLSISGDDREYLLEDLMNVGLKIDVKAFETVDIMFSVKVLNEINYKKDSEIVNIAELSGLSYENESNNLILKSSIPTGYVDLKVTKEVLDQSNNKMVEPGEKLAYTILIENTGTAKAVDVIVQDKLHKMLDYVHDIKDVSVKLNETEEISLDDLMSGVKIDVNVGEISTLQFVVKINETLDTNEVVEIENIVNVLGSNRNQNISAVAKINTESIHLENGSGLVSKDVETGVKEALQVNYLLVILFSAFGIRVLKRKIIK